MTQTIWQPIPRPKVKIIDWLDSPMTASEVAKKMNCSDRYIRRELHTLLEKGLVKYQRVKPLCRSPVAVWERA